MTTLDHTSQTPCGEIADQLSSVLVARIALDGRVLNANRGMLKLAGLDAAPDGWNVSGLFKQPSWHQIVEAISQDEVYEGKIHAGIGVAEYLTLDARIRLDGTEVLLVAEHDIEGLMLLNATVLKLNEELAEAKRELVRNARQFALSQVQTFQAEKLVSLAQLGAGMAHEINTPLGYIRSNLGTLEDYIADLLALADTCMQMEQAITDQELRLSLKEARDKADLPFLREDVQALIGESMQGLKQIAGIIQSLREISQADEAAVQWVDIEKTLDRLVEIIKQGIPAGVRISRSYATVPEVECRAAEISLVLLNLLRNALDALAGQGVIDLATGSQDDLLWIRLTDTGAGVAQADFQRIFEPFFTTKPIGSGKGLGLSLAYNIVKQHHGRIEVASEPGKGSAFTVWLPLKYAGLVAQE